MPTTARLLVSTLAFCLLPFAVTPTARAADPAPAKDFFPVMIWDHCPGDEAVIAKIKDCGITVAGFVSPQHLPLIEKAGLKAIVMDPRTSNYDWRNVDEATARKNVTSLVAETAKSPAVFGYYLRDEPPAGFYPGLAKVASVIRELSPGHWPYINLFPNYANAGQMEAANYDEYVDKFVATCKPPILSYDNYSLLDNGSLRDGYFQNLASMRNASLKHGIPFWNIVLANAHFNYAEPTPAGLRFQAYTTLAYGGRGLAYFTYFAPKIGNYRLAPIDQFGNETPTWHALRNVNLQVLELAPTLLRLKSTAVYHFDNTAGLPTPPETSLLTGAGNPNFMAGDFTHTDGTQYVMVVNKSLSQTAPIGLALRAPAKRVQLISPYTGEPTPFEGEQVWLAPGQGTLLRIER